jgi:hypothetical protein
VTPLAANDRLRSLHSCAVPGNRSESGPCRRERFVAYLWSFKVTSKKGRALMSLT